MGKNTTTRANMCAHKGASLQGYSASRARRWRDLLRKPRRCVYIYCRRKAVITMLNERFVALYSDDISPVTDCDGLANIFRSRRHLGLMREAHLRTVRHLVHFESHAHLPLNHAIMSMCCYANYLQLRR